MASEPFFSSIRERRLWGWTLAVVAAIYATLGLASTLAGMLTNGQAAVGFLAAMFIVGLTIATQGLEARPKGLEIGVALGVGVVYLMVFFRTALAERSHLIEYSVVAVFIYEALHERKRQGRRVPAPFLIAIAATTAIGTIDECIQIFLPRRGFEATDVLFNFLAAVMAVSACALLRWARMLTCRQSEGGRRKSNGA